MFSSRSHTIFTLVRCQQSSASHSRTSEFWIMHNLLCPNLLLLVFLPFDFHVQLQIVAMWWLVLLGIVNHGSLLWKKNSIRTTFLAMWIIQLFCHNTLVIYILSSWQFFYFLGDWFFVDQRVSSLSLVFVQCFVPSFDICLGLSFDFIIFYCASSQMIESSAHGDEYDGVMYSQLVCSISFS